MARQQLRKDSTVFERKWVLTDKLIYGSIQTERGSPRASFDVGYRIQLFHLSKMAA
jgi:hypothetical protein